MKESAFTSLICQKFCNYYKPGKETEVCGGYSYLQKFITPDELDGLIGIIRLNKNILTRIEPSFLCEKCDFREDGCDFVMNKSDIPCGGYLIISRLLQLLNL